MKIGIWYLNDNASYADLHEFNRIHMDLITIRVLVANHV